MVKGFIAGLVAGLVVSLLLGLYVARTSMILEYDSSKGFEETISAIEKSIKDNGWSSPGKMDFNKAMKKHGVKFGPRVVAIKLCKPQYAAEVLKDARYVSSLMPCTISVYEANDGTVKIAKMNTGLMGKLFGGVISSVMGSKVAVDEKKILTGIISEK